MKIRIIKRIPIKFLIPLVVFVASSTLAHNPTMNTATAYELENHIEFLIARTGFHLDKSRNYLSRIEIRARFYLAGFVDLLP
jgi:hypothetical protein